HHPRRELNQEDSARLSVPRVGLRRPSAALDPTHNHTTTAGTRGPHGLQRDRKGPTEVAGKPKVRGGLGGFVPGWDETSPLVRQGERLAHVEAKEAETAQFSRFLCLEVRREQ